MDPNQRQTLQINTFYYMMIVLSILSVTHIAMTMTIIFGDLAGKELVVAGTIVAITLIGSFGLIRLTKNFKLLLLEMDDKLAKTNFFSLRGSAPPTPRNSRPATSMLRNI